MENSIVINELLNDARSSTGSENDNQLAQVLEIPRQRISGIRAGSEKPSPYTCARLAQALKRDPLEIIAMVEAESAKNETQRAFWRSFKFSGMRSNLGLLLCGTLAFLGVGSYGGNAAAAEGTNSHNGDFRKSQRRRYDRRASERSRLAA